MDDPWKQLPRAAVIVYVGVLAAGSGRVVRAEQQPEAAPSNASEIPLDRVQIAPTCGPACHGGGELDPMVVEPPPDEPDPIAPTCGPECHGGYREPDIEPPPLEERKKGCAVESLEADEPALALLGLGLLAGVAGRRRRESQ